MRSNIDSARLENVLLMGGNKLGAIFQALGATFTMDADMPPLICLDPTGAGRTVLLPAESKGLFYIIVNLADAAETLTVKEDSNTTTIGTVEQDTIGFFFCSPNAAGGAATPTWVDLTVYAEAFLDGVTAGTVTASKAVVVDSNKDIGDFRNVDVTNLDAGLSGTAGTVDIFPTTASKGKLILSCTDQTGDTNVTFKPAAMGQATVVSIPDPGATTANVALTSAANNAVTIDATSAEINAVADVSTRLVSIPDAATYTLLAADSGRTHVFPDLSASCTVALPVEASGLEYTFTYKGVAADAQNWVFDSGSNTNYFTGGLGFIDVDTDVIATISGNGSSNSKCTIVTPAPGTRIHMICDGTRWILSGIAVSNTIPSFADQ
jgi:hypothetical protein